MSDFERHFNDETLKKKKDGKKVENNFQTSRNLQNIQSDKLHLHEAIKI